MKQDQESDKNLRKTIEELQSFDSDLNLWNRIHERLDYDEKVTRLIPFLPEFNSRENLWEEIENKLDEKATLKKRKKVISIISYSSAVAASVALVITIEFLAPATQPVALSTPKEVTISYSQEVVHKEHEPIKQEKKGVIPVADKVETEALTYINTNCQVNSHVCESPEFKELKSQLIELESQMGMLDEALKYGEDPELIKTKIKIENLKSRITKELIQKLNS